MLFYLIGAIAIIAVGLLSYWLAAGAPLRGQNARSPQRRANR
jgi:hypothetical protein